MAGKTELFAQWMQGSMVVADQAVSTGTRFYVHYTNGTDGAGYGTNPESPFKTLDYAIGNCTANKGDIIYLMSGHAETVASSTGALMDVAGVNVIGLGSGSLIPTITLGTATTATISVTAANCRFKNIKVTSALADVAAGITLANTADGAVIEDCIFTDGGLALELVIGISVAAACDNVKILRNRFYTDVSAETGGCASAIYLAGESAKSVIQGNFAHGHYTAACLDAATAAATSLVIADNGLYNIDTGAGLALSLHASTSGLVVRNLCCGLKATTHPIVAAGTFCAENYANDAVTTSGILDPVAGTFGS